MKKKIYLIILLLTIATFFSGITYSLFNSDALLSSNDQGVASFIFNTENLDKIDLNLNGLKPGDSYEYEFSVTNNESEKVSDVTIEYQLTIKTYHFIPLDIELYKVIDTLEYIGSCDETYTRNSENKLICNMPVQQMNKSENKKDTYKLKISFKDEYNDKKYSDLVDFINLEIDSWQKI